MTERKEWVNIKYMEQLDEQICFRLMTKTGIFMFSLMSCKLLLKEKIWKQR